jgi:hypothetical protein
VPAIRFLAPEFNYLESQFVSPEKVRASRIFESDKPILKIGGDDYFSGKIEKTNVEFSEVVVELDSGQRGGKNDVSNRIYTGMYLVADFNKPFSHTTLVMPRSQLVDSSDPFVRAVMQGVKVVVEGAEALLSGLENAVEAASNWYQIRTENSEFEQFFSTFGSDRVESYYILTPDLMERLVAFRRAVGSDVSLSFIGSVMHAYINCGPLFEINDDEGDRTVFAAYQHYYGQLRMVFDLVEAMHLNVRLWGKA